jgi:2-C-methyl-D-erythritol 4-phosphate cytidylyltransferase/2-C-methyl-D-erythritol 2,4-cyclodiphosphate synthase
MAADMRNSALEPSMPASAKTSLIIVAAGRGERLGAQIPKQYRLLAGRPLLCSTVEALARAHDFCATTIVIHAADAARYAKMTAALDPACAATLGPPAFGGVTRQESALAGLDAQAEAEPDLVLIHDGARPFPSRGLIERSIAAAAEYGAAAPGAPVTDTIKQVDASGFVAASPDRALLRALQTPQSFKFDLIRNAHRDAAAARVSGLTDDTAVAQWAGAKVFLFAGDPANVKITTAHDLAAAEQRLFAAAADIRVGQGFDVHAFGEGDHVWLGGVRIAHQRALIGHSDADVVLHAMTDALLGAIADGDIGAHFPPGDPRWRGADSALFLADSAQRVRAQGGIIAHIDATLICEAPKVGPHREAMRARIAEILGIEMGRVAVKATTSERLGFTGRGEGIACTSNATIRLPVRGSES